MILDSKNKNMFKRELAVFLNAIMFYTRIPVPKSLVYSGEILNSATRYFPFIGFIIGGIGAATFYGTSMILPIPLALILSMATTIFATGAFHEDGFADFCDGFGGGYSKDKILVIMKDSRIGTYGSIGLILMLSTKFFCLSSLQTASLPLFMVMAHALSRLSSVMLIYSANYAREDAESKVKPIGHKGSAESLLVACIFGVILLVFIPCKGIVLVIGLLCVVFILFRRYVIGKLGGYTGDVLGALQQLSEVAIYLALIVFQQNFA